MSPRLLPQPASAPGALVRTPTAAIRTMGSVAVLVLVNFERRHRAWAWLRLVMQGLPLRRVPGLCWSKVLGSGASGGFGLQPSGTHQGLFLVFECEDDARRFADASPILAAYRERASELCVVVLRACASRGSWSGTAMAVTAETPDDGPVAALTRASIRPRHARAFWRHSPAAEAGLAGAAGCLLTAGLGEAPLLRQATFSLWSSATAMDAYARSGGHQDAIRAAYGGGYFSESMFVRFVPLQLRGVWQGQRHG